MTEKMVEKGHIWKESGVTTQRRRQVEVGTLLLCNDKNNATVDKGLRYFYCLSSKFEGNVALFGTK